jgi:predicted nucleotidyltransferase
MKKNLKNINDRLLEDIVKRILKISNPDKIILFGSYARGGPTVARDIDILIIQPSDSPRYKRSRPVRLALKGLFPSKDIVVYTPEEVSEWKSASTSFIATVLKDGIVLYERK